MAEAASISISRTSAATRPGDAPVARGQVVPLRAACRIVTPPAAAPSRPVDHTEFSMVGVAG